VNLFQAQPFMIDLEPAHYIKGMHNLLNAHFTLRNFAKFDSTLKAFEAFTQTETAQQSDNNRIQVFVYLYTSKINQHFLHGTFEEGLKLVPEIEEKLADYSLYLDRHRVLVFYYKIASLYFGSGDFDTTIDYLNKIINWKVDLRNDLQCYARLLHLIAHYELGNYNLLEYLPNRCTALWPRCRNLSVVEEEIFRFLRQAFRLSARQLKPAFEALWIN
jgi:tetratricopeptide (TPR) repeat protein